MKAGIKRWIIIDGIFALIFFLVFFAISGFDLSYAIWANLGFVLLSHICLIITCIILPGSNQQMTNLASVVSVNLIYIIITSVLAILLSLILPESTKTVIIIHCVIFLLYLVVMIAIYGSILRNASIESAQSEEYAFVNQMIYLTLQVQVQLNSDKLKLKCDHILNLMRSSQYRSNDSVKAIEQIIISQLTDLATNKKGVEEQEKQLDEIQKQLNLRNNILAL